MKKSLCLLLSLLCLLCSCGTAENIGPIQTTTSLSDDRTTTTTIGSATQTQYTDISSVGSTTTTTGSASTTGTTVPEKPLCAHKDADNDELCDICQTSVIVTFDFYGINDLHGKFTDSDGNIGIDELTTYLNNARETDENAVFLSAGDMWQGGAESNLTKGKIVVDWMNEMNFAAMAIGNHEFDWGTEFIASNATFAQFPFIAINIYDRQTNQLVDYCVPSVMVDEDGLQIGIIGAVGDCYSSIATDKCADVYFKTGRDLTALVKAESERLRQQGADFIVYVLHDGLGRSTSGFISSSQMASYYDTSLSDGYVDLVFEGHTHQGYVIEDEYGVYHLQNRGDNKGGISHVEIAINAVTQTSVVNVAELIQNYTYQNLQDDPLIQQLLDKYADIISPANRVLGYNKAYRNSDQISQLVAMLYYQVAEKTWGDKYDIVLGGGFMSVRSPYNLYTGEVTYGQLQTLLPFDNQLTLCSIRGKYLLSKFLNTSNDRYFIYCGDYGNSIRNNIDPNATYYVITDTYTADYRSNNLTIVERYDPTVFARDLLADYIEEGGLN